MKTFYMGEDIESMSRERLIEVVIELGRRLEAANSNAANALGALGAIVTNGSPRSDR